MSEMEAILEPELEIYDPHHHLWHHPDVVTSPFLQNLPRQYLLPELLLDIGTGHNVTKTVFVDALSFYRADGPVELRSVGEVVFVSGVAAMGESGRYGAVRPCAGIVAKADLRLGVDVERVLEALVSAGGGRVKGIRHAGAVDVSGSVPRSPTAPPEHLYLQADFQAGFSRLSKLGLSFDAWLYYPQIGDLVELARRFPEQAIVLDHIGTPIGIGSFRQQRDQVFQDWGASIRALASCPNVFVKLGGLGMFMLGFHDPNDPEKSSSDIADLWRPYLETCIQSFGVKRCMFESNFPFDGQTCSYRTLWNVFKKIAKGCSTDEKIALFRETAARFYRLN